MLCGETEVLNGVLKVLYEGSKLIYGELSGELEVVYGETEVLCGESKLLYGELKA